MKDPNEPSKYFFRRTSISLECMAYLHHPYLVDCWKDQGLGRIYS